MIDDSAGGSNRGRGDRHAVPPAWLLVLACAPAALWVDFGVIHRHHYGDSVIPILVSLQRWTPFYWDQDRYGMLVPLLASPVRDPLANLLVQVFAGAASGLSVFFLLARFFHRDGSYPWIGLLGASTLLALAPTSYQFTYLATDQPYNLSMALGLGGLILAESPGRARWLIALGLLVLAHWVNFAVILALGPLVVLRFAFLELGRETFRPASWPRDRAGAQATLRGLAGSRTGAALILLGLGYAAGDWLREELGNGHTNFASRPFRDWPGGWLALARNARAAMAPGAWPLTLASAAALGLAVGLARRFVPGWRAALALLGAGAAIVLYLGTKYWAEMNLFSHRYVLPAVLLAQSALSTIALAPIVASLGERARRVAAPAATAVLLLAAAAGHGWPSIGAVRRGLDAALGSRTEEILSSRCTHVAGEYFRVWPSVFHANMTLRDRGESRTVYGVTFRSGPTRRSWRLTPRDDLRVAVALGDTVAEGWLNASLFPRMEEAARLSTIRVLRPAPPIPGRRDWPPGLLDR